jgi:hypothetical protein
MSPHKHSVVACVDMEIRGIPYTVQVEGTVSRVYPARVTGPSDDWAPAEGGEVEIACATLYPDSGDEMVEWLGLQQVDWTAEECADRFETSQWRVLEDALSDAAQKPDPYKDYAP